MRFRRVLPAVALAMAALVGATPAVFGARAVYSSGGLTLKTQAGRFTRFRLNTFPPSPNPINLTFRTWV